MSAAPKPVVVAARGLVRRFGALSAVDGVDLDVYDGEVFGLLGPNGAGKSTLLRLLVGMLLPTAGTVELLGMAVGAHADVLRSRIGYMTQSFSLYEDLTVEENLDFAAAIFGLGPDEAPARVEAQLARHRLEPRRAQRAGALSGGWKQRLSLAVATVHQPEILVLDEPTAGIDPEQRRRFWETLFELAEQGTTILVTTHSMDEAARCHRVALMRRGRMAALGDPRELTAELSGRVVEIETATPEAAVRALRSRPEVTSVTQIGDAVHVLLAADAAHADIAAHGLCEFLNAAGFADAKARAAQPILEDVFVAATRGERLVL